MYLRGHCPATYLAAQPIRLIKIGKIRANRPVILPNYANKVGVVSTSQRKILTDYARLTMDWIQVDLYRCMPCSCFLPNP